MNKSETIGALAAALSKAQAQMEPAKKQSTNTITRDVKTKYADLSNVLEVARKPLGDNNLAISQPVSSNPDGVVVTTLLMHSSGEWMSEDLFMPVAQKTAQAYGSAISYAKRYGVKAMLGIADEDDDGKAASEPPHAQQKPIAKAEPKKADGPARDSQAAKELYAAISGAKSLAELADVGNTINKRKAELTKAELTTLQDDYLAMKKLLEGA